MSLRLQTPRKPDGRAYPAWSIGIYAGESPIRLVPAPGVLNPVLTAHDVSDWAASCVADPFMLRVDGTWHMFFEVFDAP